MLTPQALRGRTQGFHVHRFRSPCRLLDRERDGAPGRQHVEQGPQLGHGADRGGVHRRDQATRGRAPCRRPEAGPTGLDHGHGGAAAVRGVRCPVPRASRGTTPVLSISQVVVATPTTRSLGKKVVRGRARVGVVEPMPSTPSRWRRGAARPPGSLGSGRLAPPGSTAWLTGWWPTAWRGDERRWRALGRGVLLATWPRRPRALTVPGVQVQRRISIDHRRARRPELAVGRPVLQSSCRRRRARWEGPGRSVDQGRRRTPCSVATTERRLAAFRRGRPCRDALDGPAKESGRGGDEPALGHGDAHHQHGAVAGGRLQLHDGVPGPPQAAAGSARCMPASVVSGPPVVVSCVADSDAWSDAGESSTTTQATTAMTAPTPTRTMTALR